MGTTTTWGGELTNLESRADVESLEDLQAQRRKLLDENKRLLALHGPFGLYDDYRKQALEAQKIVARRNLIASGAKVTETMIDSEAYGSTAYQKILDDAITDRVECLVVMNAIKSLEERIKSRDTALRAYASEPK